MMAAHRVPPQMMGIMPNNVGGLGMWKRLVVVFCTKRIDTFYKKRLHEI